MTQGSKWKRKESLVERFSRNKAGKFKYYLKGVHCFFFPPSLFLSQGSQIILLDYSIFSPKRGSCTLVPDEYWNRGKRSVKFCSERDAAFLFANSQMTNRAESPALLSFLIPLLYIFESIFGASINRFPIAHSLLLNEIICFSGCFLCSALTCLGTFSNLRAKFIQVELPIPRFSYVFIIRNNSVSQIPYNT